MSKLERLKFFLSQAEPAFPLKADINKDNLLLLNLTADNKDLRKVDLSDTNEFSNYIFGTIKKSGAVAGIGGYAENRDIYRRSNHFSNAGESRSIHLGVDIWMPAQTQVIAPIDGIVHSFADNNSFGDYGPTIILQHQIKEITFYTLYGHLSRNSLINLHCGMQVKKGEEFAKLGEPEENVQWPPHLHFQLMFDAGEKQGDYPGVCLKSEASVYMANCPDPNILLNLDVLRG